MKKNKYQQLFWDVKLNLESKLNELRLKFNKTTDLQELAALTEEKEHLVKLIHDAKDSYDKYHEVIDMVIDNVNTI